MKRLAIILTIGAALTGGLVKEAAAQLLLSHTMRTALGLSGDDDDPYVKLRSPDNGDDDEPEATPQAVYVNGDDGEPRGRLPNAGVEQQVQWNLVLRSVLVKFRAEEVQR